MSKSELEAIIRDQFLEELVSEGTGVDDMKTLSLCFDDAQIRSIFESWSKKQREIFFIKKVGFINLHIRSESPGFWDVRKNIIKDFEFLKKQFGIKCLFVVVVRNQRNGSLGGYILEDMISKPIIRKPSEQKEDFKINENVLDINEKFINLNELVKALLARGNSTRKTVMRRTKKAQRIRLDCESEANHNLNRL